LRRKSIRHAVVFVPGQIPARRFRINKCSRDRRASIEDIGMRNYSLWLLLFLAGTALADAPGADFNAAVDTHRYAIRVDATPSAARARSGFSTRARRIRRLDECRR
jgi:hypothetical protein